MTGVFWYIVRQGIKDRSSLAHIKRYQDGFTIKMTGLYNLDLVLLKESKSFYTKFLIDAGIPKGGSIFSSLKPSYAAMYLRGVEGITSVNPLPINLSTYEIDIPITTYEEFLTIVRSALFLYALEYYIAKKAVENIGPNGVGEAFGKDAYKQFYKVVMRSYPNVSYTYNTNDNKSQHFIITAKPLLSTTNMSVDKTQYNAFNVYLKRLLMRRS